ncbi:MAG TPA: T9SS type A sorting domain-containing protein, partial [Flavobacterium sp.]|nr:T9SS type A sorting domain-containing protein [Flavobacterium sp.]
SYGQVEDYTVNIVSAAKESDATASSDLSFTVYPNPVKDGILRISNVDNGTYRVFNSIGQEVSKGAVEDGAVQVSNINSGTYMIEVTSNGKSAVKRFIKQ